MYSEPPSFSRRLLYIYRIGVKLTSFALFGLGTIILVTLIFPVLRLVLHPRKKFQKYARRFVSWSLRFFAAIICTLRGIEMDVDDRRKYRRLSSKIIAANHPSLLDVALLLSLIPNADCIVRGNLSRTFVRGVVRQLYIPNSLSFHELARSCTESLKAGNCLIIFPEGTRTPRSNSLVLKRGTARLSLVSGCAIIPIHIGGTDKYGLGKRDPLFAFNPREKYVYRFRMQGEISPAKYAGLEIPLAARRLTSELKEVLLHPVG